MNSNVQLISFIVSYFFGMLFYFLTYLNFQLIKPFKLLLQHLLSFIFVIDMTIIYIIIIYKINNGYFHLYFMIMVFLGFLFGYIIFKKFLSKINVKEKIRLLK